MKSELKIVKAPCTCPKCAPTDRNAAARLASLTRLLTLASVPPKKAAPTQAKYTMADYAKAIAALVSQGKWELPWPDAPPDLNERIRKGKPRPETTDEIAARLQKVARQQLAEMGVPLPPDLNEAIRRGRK